MEKVWISSKLPKDLSESPFFMELESLKKSGEFIDLTISSPMRAGFSINFSEAVKNSNADFHIWEPLSSGSFFARRAVSQYYSARGGAFLPEEILLTSSTSEAYSFLFKTFCEAGDTILSPVPGYPLIETLAHLEHLNCHPYFLKRKSREVKEEKISSAKNHIDDYLYEKNLKNDFLKSEEAFQNEKLNEISRDDYTEDLQYEKSFPTLEKNSASFSKIPSDKILKKKFPKEKEFNPELKNDETFRSAFQIDLDSLLSAPENAKILVLVSPHNPTGHAISKKEWEKIISFCEERNLILVVDEVFGDYTLSNSVKRSWLYSSRGVPVFWLNGLSKTVGAPQLKLGWIAWKLPDSLEKEFKAALEYVSDAFLSVSSSAQSFAPILLKDSLDYEKKVNARLSNNFSFLRENFSSLVCPQILGGWYAALHFEADDEALTLSLLKEKRVLVQPGFFFDFEEDGWIVISLLPEEKKFAEAIRRILEFHRENG